MVLKYTDIDYTVFTDAARHVVNGESPYDRATYRYTPLLAYILVPNIIINEVWGKLLFAFFDLAIAELLRKLLFMRLPIAERDAKSKVLILLSWSLNPIVINISTRGNAESLISFVVLVTLFLYCHGYVKLSGLCLALAVHLKIYPVLYGLPMLRGIRPSQRLSFVLVCAVAFLLYTLPFYYLYGWSFAHETYFYHLSRRDTRHNLSLYFLAMYLGEGAHLLSLLSFVPQFALALLLCFSQRGQDIFFTLTIQTMAFVTFNKVITVQYFVWYLAILPLVIPSFPPMPLGSRAAHYFMLVVSCWLATLGLWLWGAYRLEFLGENTFGWLWLAGMGFFVANVSVIAAIANYSISTPLFDKHGNVLRLIRKKMD